jgi:hypothetical protein
VRRGGPALWDWSMHRPPVVGSTAGVLRHAAAAQRTVHAHSANPTGAVPGRKQCQSTRGTGEQGNRVAARLRCGTRGRGSALPGCPVMQPDAGAWSFRASCKPLPAGARGHDPNPPAHLTYSFNGWVQ